MSTYFSNSPYLAVTQVLDREELRSSAPILSGFKAICSSAIHCASGRAINRPTTNLRPYCSCPIYRALATVSSDDESPNYRALTVQLRKS